MWHMIVCHVDYLTPLNILVSKHMICYLLGAFSCHQGFRGRGFVWSGCAVWVQSMQCSTDLSWSSGKGNAIVIGVDSSGTALAIETGQPLMHNTPQVDWAVT